ncbi:hypothetical protein [Kytococcus sedentarius]|uniref:hypothetical protein n=1 Tax=Kytococcus sedentarius TaxID=1276 RepID=UPI00194FCE40|nr:hypothetical protein [Kytococcus sedentarius]QRO86504.1 hypothetical protein I6J30_06310 [Kytococcus sedentarius]
MGASAELAPIAVSLVLLLSAAAFTYLSVQGTAFVSPFHTYIAAVSGPASLALPLAISLVAGWALRQRLVDGHVENTRTRAPLRRTLVRTAWPGVLAALALGVAIPLVCGVMTLVILPATGYSYYPDSYYVEPHQIPQWNADAVTAGGLTSASPWVYVAVHALWAGAWGVVLAVMTQALVLVLRRPLAALVLPFALITALSIILALARLETLTPTASQFPTTLSPFPLWHVLPSFIAFAAAAAGLWAVVLRRLPELPHE